MKPDFLRIFSALAVFCIVCAAAPATAHESFPERHSLMPVPLYAAFGQGSLSIEPGFSVSGEGYWEPRLTRAVERMISQLACPVRGTGSRASPGRSRG
jgi:hypothetical protein